MNRVTNKFIDILNNINPFQVNISLIEKRLRLILLLIIGVLVMRVTGFLLLLTYAINYDDLDFGMPLYMLPSIVLTIIIYLLYRQNKKGWLLLMIYLVYSVISVFLMLIIISKDNTDVLSNVFNDNSISFHVFVLVYYVVIIKLMSDTNIREKFGINKQTMLLTISITASIVGLGYLIIY